MPFTYPRPNDEHSFEELCLRLLRKHWDCPNAQRHGRRGHRQFGVDIFGLSNGRVHGAQCKHKENGRKLNLAKDVLAEVTKAEGFTPQLDSFLILTTTRRDPVIQRQVLKASLERQKERKFSVNVFFWDDLEELLREYGDVRDLVYGGVAASQADSLLIGQARVLEGIGEVKEIVGSDRISEKINDAADLLKELDFEAARKKLLKIQQEDWSRTDAHQKYRILANLGNVAEREGDEKEAARLYLEAKGHDPKFECVYRR